MPTELYEVIGTPFGKLPDFHKKPILLGDDSLRKSGPFLKGVRVGGGGAGLGLDRRAVNGRRAINGRDRNGQGGNSRVGNSRSGNSRGGQSQVNRIFADGVIEEMIVGNVGGGTPGEIAGIGLGGDLPETMYIVSLTYQGVNYFVRICDRKEDWLILAVERGSGQPKFWSAKHAFLFAFLLIVSAIGYYFEFGGTLSPSNRDGDGGLPSNPTVYEAYKQESGAGGSDDSTVGQPPLGTIPSGQGETSGIGDGQSLVGTIPSGQAGQAGTSSSQSAVGTIPSGQALQAGTSSSQSAVGTIPSGQAGQAGTSSSQSAVGTILSGQAGQAGGSSEMGKVSPGQPRSPEREGESPKAAQTNPQQGFRQDSPTPPNEPRTLSTPSGWLQEKALLQKEINRLKQENEKLRNTLSQHQKTQ